MENGKTAVVLFNLGGPLGPQDIYPFLVNFFMDKNIIRAPFFVRFLLSRYIAFKRSRNEAGSSYAELGGKSPLLENTKAQAAALQNQLGEAFKVFVCMRYWRPMADEVANDVAAYQPDRIVLLPLYPQYSTTTTKSSFEEWFNASAKRNIKVPVHTICCYPTDPGFIRASADNILGAYRAMQTTYGRAPRLLFSAHGLPEKIVAGGDPYQWACEESAKKIAVATGIENLDWSICYQSRVGPLKWIGPSTEEALHQAAKDQVGVLIYPHAFVSEHVETLVEIEKEYRHMAEQIGVPAFGRVPTVSTHPDFIGGLANLIRNTPSSGTLSPRQCPMHFSQCCHNVRT